MDLISSRTIDITKLAKIIILIIIILTFLDIIFLLSHF